MPDFRLPDLGEGVTEAEIDRWLVSEGEEIAEDDLLVEVITDKATAEIPSPFAGTVTRIHVGEGNIVPVGTVLITIGEAAISEDGANRFAASIHLSSSSAGTTSTKELREPDGPAEERAGQEGAGNGAVKAMPPVRKLARALGVDIARVAGSGPGGRVLRADVEAAASPTGSGGTPASISPPGKTARRVPLRGVRRIIAEHMLKAHTAIPPVTHVEECDVTELNRTRAYAYERHPEGPRLTYLPFIVKAVVAGLKKHPALNSSLDEAAGEIVYHERYDIGISVDAPHGLVVPVVRKADRKSVWDIAAEIEDLAAGARDGNLKAEELKGSTFTVTSPGKFGGLMATPIVNYPEAAILGVHRATDRPVVVDGQIVVRTIMNLSITFDHRLLDGVTAAKFCLEVVDLLQHPAALLLED